MISIEKVGFDLDIFWSKKRWRHQFLESGWILGLGLDWILIIIQCTFTVQSGIMVVSQCAQLCRHFPQLICSFKFIFCWYIYMYEVYSSWFLKMQKKKKRNLSTAWTDYKKALDSVNRNIKDSQKTMINSLNKQWKTGKLYYVVHLLGVHLRHQNGEITTDRFNIMNSRFQEDSSSGLLSIFCFLSLTATTSRRLTLFLPDVIFENFNTVFELKLLKTEVLW